MITILVTLSCSSSPEKIAQQERALDARIYSHNRDAQMYRNIDNDEMASYFESQANETQNRKNELNYGPTEFLLDLGIEATK